MTEEVTERRPLFRPEAVEAHARGRAAGDEGLELREERTTWAFRGLLLALAAALVVAFTYHVDQTVRGPAVASGRTAVVEVPSGAVPRLRLGQQVRLGGANGTITTFEGSSLQGNVAVVRVRATFDEPVSSGEATILLSSQTLAELVRRRGNG